MRSIVNDAETVARNELNRLQGMSTYITAARESRDRLNALVCEVAAGRDLLDPDQLEELVETTDSLATEALKLARLIALAHAASL